MSESKLQKKIIDNLTLKGWEVVKVVLCNRPGWPDLTAYKDHKVIFLEVKDKGEEAEPLQEFIHGKLRAQGFKVFVIDTWDSYLQTRKLF